MIQDGDQLSHKTSQKWWRCHGCLQRILITGRAVEMDSQKRSPANSQCLTCLLLGENTHETHMEKKEEVLSLLRFEFCDSKGIHSKNRLQKRVETVSHPQVSPFFLRYNSDILPRWGADCIHNPRSKKTGGLPAGTVVVIQTPDSIFIWLFGQMEWIFSHIFRQIRPHHAGWVKMDDILIIWLSSFALLVNRKYISKLQPMRPEPRATIQFKEVNVRPLECWNVRVSFHRTMTIGRIMTKGFNMALLRKTNG